MHQSEAAAATPAADFWPDRRVSALLQRLESCTQGAALSPGRVCETRPAAPPLSQRGRLHGATLGERGGRIIRRVGNAGIRPMLVTDGPPARRRSSSASSSPRWCRTPRRPRAHRAGPHVHLHRRSRTTKRRDSGLQGRPRPVAKKRARIAAMVPGNPSTIVYTPARSTAEWPDGTALKAIAMSTAVVVRGVQNVRGPARMQRRAPVSSGNIRRRGSTHVSAALSQSASSTVAAWLMAVFRNSVGTAEGLAVRRDCRRNWIQSRK